MLGDELKTTLPKINYTVHLPSVAAQAPCWIEVEIRQPSGRCIALVQLFGRPREHTCGTGWSRRLHARTRHRGSAEHLTSTLIKITVSSKPTARRTLTFSDGIIQTAAAARAIATPSTSVYLEYCLNPTAGGGSTSRALEETKPI